MNRERGEPEQAEQHHPEAQDPLIGRQEHERGGGEQDHAHEGGENEREPARGGKRESEED